MRRHFINAFAAVALVLGGWGGALAGVVCGHAHGGAQDSEHACCRARTKAKSQKSAHASTHSSTHSATSSSTRAAAGDGGHCHAQNSTAAATADDESHEVARAAWPAAGFARPSVSCGHCIWRSGTPPAAPKISEREGPRRVDVTPAAEVRLTPTASTPHRDTSAAPARAAPPGATRLYVLINCFLI